MSAEPLPTPLLRVEYLDFQNVAEHREFRLRAYGRDGSAEFRFRIAIAAFAAGQVRLQDGPDVCYQRLLRAVAAGETASAGVITIDEAELANYREIHTKVAKHRRSWTPPPAPTPAIVPPTPPRARRLPVAPLADDNAERALEAGQRVRHAAFGVGVTAASNRGHTVVCFDEDGRKTFVTALLKVDVLSAPHTWETSLRGTNRLRPTLSTR